MCRALIERVQIFPNLAKELLRRGRVTQRHAIEELQVASLVVVRGPHLEKAMESPNLPRGSPTAVSLSSMSFAEWKVLFRPVSW